MRHEESSSSSRLAAERDLPWLGSLAFLVLLVIASALPYVSHLGFYGDDWSFIASLEHTEDQSLSGLSRTLLGQRAGKDLRFVQVALLAGLFGLFGTDPLGYHVAIMLMLAGVAVLTWLVMEELTGSRLFAMAVAVIYLLLPHYSTNRFWLSSLQVPASIGFLLLAVYALLRLLPSAGRARALWFVLAAAGVVLSGFAYETALPLVLLTPLLVWIAVRRSEPRPSQVSVRAALVCSIVLIALAFGVLAMKSTISERVSGAGSFVSQMKENAQRAVGSGQHPAVYGLELRRATVVAFGLYGVLLPESAVDAWRASRFRMANLVVVGFVALAILAFFWATSRRHPLPGRRSMALMLLLGLVVFLLGYGVFLFNRGVIHTPTGVGNRTAMAVALGVAITFVAVSGLIASWLPRRFAGPLFAVAIASIGTFGLMTLLAISSFWIEAGERAEEVLAVIEAGAPPLDDETILIVGGFCPYAGPAIVFDAPWDLQGALRLRLGQPRLRAEVVTARLAVEEEGLVSNVAYRKLHRYGERLLQFDVASSTTRPLTNREEAAGMLAEAAYRRCGVSHPSIGVPILGRDRFPSDPLVLYIVEPSGASVGAPFNVQPDGRSAFVVRSSGADPGTRVTMDGLGLPTVFGSESILSAVLPAGLLDRPGSYEVRLDNGYEISNALPFVVRPPEP